MTRRLNWIIALLLLIIGLPYYWLLIDNRPGSIASQPVTVGQLRELADALPGPHPSGVEMELVGWRKAPGTLFAAGAGLQNRFIGIMAYRLPVTGGKPIVIDSGLGLADVAGMRLDQFLPGNQRTVDRAMDEAGLILITHEHPDHIGGMIAWARNDADVMHKAFGKQRMTPPQSAFVSQKLGIVQRDQSASLAAPPRAIAPGVVAIPAPSHTPGSQMFFVQLADGREYLFTGDIATLAISWEALRARSRLIGDFVVPEDRPAVFSWLKTIRALKQASPALNIIPGHDTSAVLELADKGQVRRDFNLVPIGATTQ
ncbi:MBL fold metallo-hydrolase [Novosphingobium sp.]|uniref:MBL fold metallo-hydrolase n=1 Tax=Novosphingobium sp. TaxID=1874826 RepID=UPI0025DA2872|nr:MBL fold metallo-hydrolase [Novosphingobium sp.]